MEIYEMIDLQDCPRCFGPSILEEENHSYYVMCMDCGCQQGNIHRPFGIDIGGRF